MRPDEKLALLNGVRRMSLAANERLGIPALHVVQGAMGISAKDADGRPVAATAFPANVGMAATWDPGLIEKEGAVIARQARRLGRAQVLGPVTDLAGSALSGRTFETYGEDPWLASRMVAGYIPGVQGEGAIATAIYTGGPSNERAAREFDLRPLEVAVADAGIWAVMPGAGDPSGDLVGNFLENKLGFRGFPVFRRPPADEAAGESPAITERVRGVLRALFTSGAFDAQAKTSGDAETPAERALARTAATESIVLLKNEGGLLPLDRNRLRSIAVFGPNAAVNRMAAGSFTVATNNSVTPVAALKNMFGSRVVTGPDTPAEAAKIAQSAEVAIIFAGTGSGTEAEGADRTSLGLPAGQDELIEAVAKANRHTIVVITAGSPVSMSQWIKDVPAVLDAWFPGEEGGNAIADVLTGAVNPSGRLPVTFPAKMDDLPPADAGLYPGYRHFDRSRIVPLFPFGFGLSYTRFEYGDLTVTPARVHPVQLVEVSLTVRNAGARAGKETVQLYVHARDSAIERAVQDLRAFQQVDLQPGESKRIYFTLTDSATSYFEERRQDWVQDQGAFEVRVGSSSRDIRATGEFSVYE